MVHNWLGISDETKKQAERVAKLGVAVFAVDVYGQGVRASEAKAAVALAGKYKSDRKLFASGCSAAWRSCARRRGSRPAKSSRSATASGARVRSNSRVPAPT